MWQIFPIIHYVQARFSLYKLFTLNKLFVKPWQLLKLKLEKNHNIKLNEGVVLIIFKVSYKSGVRSTVLQLWYMCQPKPRLNSNYCFRFCQGSSLQSFIHSLCGVHKRIFAAIRQPISYRMWFCLNAKSYYFRRFI